MYSYLDMTLAPFGLVTTECQKVTSSKMYKQTQVSQYCAAKEIVLIVQSLVICSDAPTREDYWSTS